MKGNLIMNIKIKLILCFVTGFIAGILFFILVNNEYVKQNAKAIYFVAGKYYEQENYDMAAALLNQSIAKFDGDYGPYYLLGNIYKIKSNSELSLQMYKLALNKIDNDNNKTILYDKKNIENKIQEIENVGKKKQ
jgi:tetratricopeptide (TPR) repeat protein